MVRVKLGLIMNAQNVTLKHAIIGYKICRQKVKALQLQALPMRWVFQVDKIKETETETEANIF